MAFILSVPDRKDITQQGWNPARRADERRAPPRWREATDRGRGRGFQSGAGAARPHWVDSS